MGNLKRPGQAGQRGVSRYARSAARQRRSLAGFGFLQGGFREARVLRPQQAVSLSGVPWVARGSAPENRGQGRMSGQG